MSTTLWNNRLQEISRRGLKRRMKTVTGPVGPEIKTPDGTKLLFCSNDYLGLACNPRIATAIASTTQSRGAGSGGSRLISGNSDIHNQLESSLATFLGTEKAVLFSTGYQANVGALSSLTQKGDQIFSDELVHASIIDGCRLSKAKTHVFRHRDVTHLEDLLSKYRSNGINLIVTDAVFSMDGDQAPLRALVEIAKRFDAALYVDEAHAFGVIGTQGRGLCDALGVADKVAIRMGTFGKALGTFGAFIATKAAPADLMISRARSLLYSTATSAAIIEGMREALNLAQNADNLRSKLQQNIDFFKIAASKAGLPKSPSETAIQPIHIGDSDKTMHVSSLLWDAGIFVQGIRPPTVAEGTSRLRITISASHEHHHIQQLVNTLSKALLKADQ